MTDAELTLRGALHSMNAMRNVAGLATSHIVGVHFYSFGGALATARWLRAVADGRFEMNPAADAFATTG